MRIELGNSHERALWKRNKHTECKYLHEIRDKMEKEWKILKRSYIWVWFYYGFSLVSFYSHML